MEWLEVRCCRSFQLAVMMFDGLCGVQPIMRVAMLHGISVQERLMQRGLKALMPWCTLPGRGLPISDGALRARKKFATAASSQPRLHTPRRAACV